MSVQIKAKHTIYQLFVKFIMHNMEWEIDEYDKSKDTLFTTSAKPKQPAFVWHQAASCWARGGTAETA